MNRHKYSAYGLSVESEVLFPELTPSEGAPQVVVRHGKISLDGACPSGSFGRADGDGCLIHLEGVGSFFIRGGKEIIVGPTDETSGETLREFLLGLCFSIILHQRGMLALHSSSIQTPRGAVLFMGQTGCGKSTLLGAFLKRGYRMMADDVTGISLGVDQRPQVLPGYPQTRLRDDSAGKLAMTSRGWGRSGPISISTACPPPSSLPPNPLPCSRSTCWNLGSEDTIEIEDLRNSEKFDVLVGNTYRKVVVDGLGLRPSHFRLAVAAANAAVVRRVRRPISGFRLRELADAVEADFRGLRPRES